MPELLPCPFCGKTPRMEKDEYLWRTDFRVKCSCGVSTKGSGSKKVVVKRWNTRIKETRDA